MLGLPGSGKTTFSKKLQTELELERFSVDEEYSRLGGDLFSVVGIKILQQRPGIR